MSEVRTPMGSSVGRIALVMVSALSKRIAPAIKHAGIRFLLSGPMTIRRRCGMIRPTKPIIPDTETQIAVMSEALIRRIFRMRSVSTPSVLAVRIPNDITLRSLE